MSLAKDLMQVGIPDQAAKRLGYQVGAAIVAAGTTNADAAAIPQTATLVQISGASTAGVKLPATAELGVEYVLANTSANTPFLYPPTGGNINGQATTTGAANFTANGTIKAIRINNTDWAVIVGAAG